MRHTYSSVHTHVVFATKARRPLIAKEFRNLLHRYIAGVLRNKEIVPIAVGGIEDHVHLLVRILPRMSIAEVVRLAKCNSSKWVHEQLQLPFAWQRGYSAFSVSASIVPIVKRYIERQEAHHKRRTLEDELLQFLRRHEVPPAGGGLDFE